MANTFDYEGDEDIIAHYEDQDSDGERNFSEAEEATFDNDKDNESATKRKIDPSTSRPHTVRNPQPKLNIERLKGPNGIQTIEKYFEGFKFYGKGHEKTDIDRIMKRLEHWSHRLFPKYHFDDFDLLITEQIQKQKQAKLQVSASASASAAEDAFDELLMQSDNISHSQIPTTTISTTGNELTDEVREKIERNKQLAIQRRLERQNEREEAKRKKLAEGMNSEPPNENGNLTVNGGIDISQADGTQQQTNENMNEVTCADKSEEGILSEESVIQTIPE